MGLPSCRRVDRSQIDDAPGIPGFLPDDVHPTAPCCWGIAGDSLYHSESYVSLQLIPDLLDPVSRYGRRAVDGYRIDTLFYVDPERGLA